MNDLFAGESAVHQTVMLAHETDLAGFRQHARRLLAAGIVPESVSWHCSNARTADLFASLSIGSAPATIGSSATGSVQGKPGTSAFASTPALSRLPGNTAQCETAPEPPIEDVTSSDATAECPAPTARVPASFLELCQTVILHQDPQRFGLLYRLLWRLVHEPGLRDDPLDADRLQASHMAQAVRRDLHKMKAFVRFRTVQDDIFRAHPEGGLLHVAWFEPEHHIVEAVAPFFARRFTQMRWAILTPERSVEWDGYSPHARHCVSSLPLEGASPALGRPGGGLGALRFSQGASKSDAPPADAGEQLWLTYYQSIFNPARLKLKMMQKEMPRKYWRNLPEAQFISTLAAGAHERRLNMIDEAPRAPQRRIPIAKATGAAAERANNLSAPLSAAAGGVPDLATLRARAQQCRDCPIGEHATQAVCGEGPVNARVMVVGEQPGDQEDLQGRPFVGPAGQLFDKALAELGVSRDELFVTNAVKHFKYEPRGRRRMHKSPSQHEAAACSQWLTSEIALVKPGAALALGATAAASLLGRRVAVLSERGKWLKRADGLSVLVTLHPAALLRMDHTLQDNAYADWLSDLKKALVASGATAAPAADKPAARP